MYIYISRPLCAGAARDQLERGQGHDPVGQVYMYIDIDIDIDIDIYVGIYIYIPPSLRRRCTRPTRTRPRT